MNQQTRNKKHGVSSFLISIEPPFLYLIFLERNALGEVKSSNGSSESQQVDYYIDSAASSTVELPPPVSQNRPAVTIDTNTSNPLTQSNSFPSTPAQNPIVVKNPSPAATPTAAPLSNPNTTNNNANGVVVPMNSNNSSSNNILSNVPGTAPVTISNNHSNNSQPIPNLQVEDYLSTKMRLAQIMRDFNEKKICFIGLDGSRIFVQQYQSISARVKAGEDIQNFLRGKLVMFVTAVDKKKRSITETQLFIPDFEIHND
jgi:hypothetical protein